MCRGGWASLKQFDHMSVLVIWHIYCKCVLRNKTWTGEIAHHIISFFSMQFLNVFTALDAFTDFCREQKGEKAEVFHILELKGHQGFFLRTETSFVEQSCKEYQLL